MVHRKEWSESGSDSGSGSDSDMDDLEKHFTDQEMKIMHGAGIVDSVRDLLFSSLPHVMVIKGLLKGISKGIQHFGPSKSLPRVNYGTGMKKAKKPSAKRHVSAETLENLRRGREARQRKLGHKTGGTYNTNVYVPQPNYRIN